MREGNLIRSVYWQPTLQFPGSGNSVGFALVLPAMTKSPVLFPLAAGQRNKLLHVQLAPVSLGGSRHLSLRAAWLWDQLGYTWPEPGLSWSIVSGALSWRVKLGKGDLPVFCDKMMYQGKMRSEQSLASEQLFPFK